MLTLPCMRLAAARGSKQTAASSMHQCGWHARAHSCTTGTHGSRTSSSTVQQVFQTSVAFVNSYAKVLVCMCMTTMPSFCMPCCLLQVRSDCPPRQLVDFLLSDSGVQADQVGPALTPDATGSSPGCASSMCVLEDCSSLGRMGCWGPVISLCRVLESQCCMLLLCMHALRCCVGCAGP